MALFQALPVWLLAAPLPAALLVLGPLVSGFANGLQNPPIHSLITLRPPAHVRAQVITAVFTCATIAAPLALLAAGPAFAAWGPRVVIGIAAGVQTVAMVLLALGALRAAAPRLAVSAQPD